MVSTRQRHTRSTVSTAPSTTVNPQPQSAQLHSARRSRTRARVKTTSANSGTKESCGQADGHGPLSTKNNQHPSGSPDESDTQQPGLPRASLIQAPLTARGTRRNASSARRRPTSSKASAAAPALDNELEKDAVEDVEEPRRQRVEAVEIVQRAFRAKKAIKEHQTRDSSDQDASPDSKAQISSGPTTAEALSMDSHATVSTLPMDAIETDATEGFLSQMSLSPPPTISFEHEDEDYGSPWLMVYDSNPSASRYRRRTLQANWTIEDLERELQEDNPNPDPNPDPEDDSRLDYAREGWRVSQSPVASRSSPLSPSRRWSRASRAGHDLFSPAHSPERDAAHQPRERPTEFDMEMDAGQEEDDDDPFGFAKVERQLQRTKSMRPKPVAINNWHRRDWEWDIIHTSTPQKEDDNQQSSTPDEDSSVFDISIDSSPVKVPEAGMPASYGAGSAKARSGAKRIMRTEYLESMLPRPRKKGASNHRRPVDADSWTVNMRGAQESENRNELSSSSEEEEEEEEVLVRRRRGTVVVTKPRGTRKQQQEPVKDLKAPAPKRLLLTTNTTKSKDKRAAKVKDAEKVTEEESSGWTAEQLAAQKERIRYFQQIDDFEMDVETVR
ncbi:unnamed protein product [Mortierella alpina]